MFFAGKRQGEKMLEKIKTFSLVLHPIKLGDWRAGKQLQSQVTIKYLLGNKLTSLSPVEVS